MITFRFNPDKAAQAIVWMLGHGNDREDFHTLLKTVYFADKQVLNSLGRPIFGASYRAMNYGPVPIEVYEMLKCEPYWLSEMDGQGYLWKPAGPYHVALDPQAAGNRSLDMLSRVEMSALQAAFDRSKRLTFTQRTRETHGFDWAEGVRRPFGQMWYEDMIDAAHPEREELINELNAMGPRVVL